MASGSVQTGLAEMGLPDGRCRSRHRPLESLHCSITANLRQAGAGDNHRQPERRKERPERRSERPER
jgi:hypothetical protein